MRYLFVVCFICLYLNSGTAQGQDNKIGAIEYNLKIKGAIPKKKNAILYFNGHESLFVYDKQGLSDSTETSMQMTYSQDFAVVTVSSVDSVGAQVYRNFDTKEIVFRETETKPTKAFVVEDSFIPIRWTILNKYKYIDSFKVQQAVGVFRGREYCVWFAKDIPYPIGPWKLYGLPGVILEGNDKDHFVEFTFKASKHVTGTIERPNEAIKKSLKEYVEFTDNYMQHVVDELQKNQQNLHLHWQTQSTVRNN
ncbi:MAG: GLPGLI family protein [Edaphocola sp.]